MKYRFRNIIQLILPVLLLLITSNANAYEWMIEGRSNFGGTTLVSLTDTSNYEKNIRAGGGYSIAAGVNQKLSTNFELRALLGYTTDSFSGRELTTNTTFEYKWNHNPIDFLIYSRVGELNYGAGLTYHLNPELIGKGFFSGKGTKYNNTFGVLVQVDYRYTERFYLGFNYVDIAYKSTSSKTIDGSSVSFVLGYVFER